MKCANDFRSQHPIVPLAASLSLFVAACAGADEADDVPSFNPPGAGGSGQAAPPSGVSGAGAQVPGVGGAGSGAVTGSNTEGNGGSIAIGAGGSSPGVASGAAGSAAATGGTGGAPAGAAGSSMMGAAGNGNVPPPAGPGRVGAELCPPGPFGSPIPANPQIVARGAVDENNFFILEGAVWTGDALYLSEIGQGNVSQIDRFTLAGGFERGVFSNTGSNGLALDAEGNLLLAAHDVGGISRLTLPGGQIARGNQTRNGQRFNSPNDLVIRGDGNVYFTDPDFQSPDGRIQGGTFVYRIAPPLGAGEITVIEQGINNPNGITLSPDGNTLYVAGSQTLREYALDAAGAPTVVGDLATGNEIDGPDGMGMDCAGNIYASRNGAGFVAVFSPAGESLGTIGNGAFGGQGVTNVAFGGPNRTTLFITTFSGNGNTGLFSVELNVPGLPY
jgi:gluconolactonase